MRADKACVPTGETAVAIGSRGGARMREAVSVCVAVLVFLWRLEARVDDVCIDFRIGKTMIRCGIVFASIEILNE